MNGNTANQTNTGAQFFKKWGKYLMPSALILVGIAFVIMLFLILLSGASDDEDCFTDDGTTKSSASGIGGDWKESNSVTHKAMQYAADQFKNTLHMSGDNIAAALAIGIRESQFNPKTVNPSGAVKGIWQWGAGGINGNRYGNTENTVESQVALAIKELKTTHAATLTHMRNADIEHSMESWDV